MLAGEIRPNYGRERGGGERERGGREGGREEEEGWGEGECTDHFYYMCSAEGGEGRGEVVYLLGRGI